MEDARAMPHMENCIQHKKKSGYHGGCFQLRDQQTGTPDLVDTDTAQQPL
jgi:hypothetical protein